MLHEPYANYGQCGIAPTARFIGNGNEFVINMILVLNVISVTELFFQTKSLLAITTDIWKA